jgi:hypothetical protein
LLQSNSDKIKRISFVEQYMPVKHKICTYGWSKSLKHILDFTTPSNMTRFVSVQRQLPIPPKVPPDHFPQFNKKMACAASAG